MSIPYARPVSPFPGWARKMIRLPRPITEEDVAAFIQDQEMFRRETGAGEIRIIHKFGIIEINCIVGERLIEVWFAPEMNAVALEYVDALLSTRF